MSNKKQNDATLEKKEENLADKLFYKKKNYFEESDDKDIDKCYKFADEYKNFINISKTERETCRNAVEIVKQAGFKEFKFGDKLKVGDKRYYVNRDKSIAVFKIGKNNLEEHGIKILGAHIDSPRIDLKQNPMYEDSGFCFFKTHYYGGIKKYQWTTIPLALHGTIIRKDGTSVNIVIGEDENDPIFYINDLLPHLGQEQMMSNGYKIITGEQLNLVIGGKAYKGEKIKDKIKLNVLAILNEKYGILEEDFLSSELCAVPAYKARDIGFDRAFIGGYGHDDKSCAYPALRAILDTKSDDTILTLLVDKEEIGSEGNTGMKSKVYEDLMDEISESLKCTPRKVRAKSKCLSADVTSCFDPNFPNVYERMNASMISCGASINKFTGSGGKSSANDASAEFMGEIRKIFRDTDVIYQTSELGKVDLGGGGTIAKYVAQLNIDTIDIGVPVISMHAPYELISKADLYNTYKAFCCFVNKPFA